MGGGRIDVLHDEQLFAGLDETQVAAGQVFNRGRILTQPTRFVPKAGVLGADARQRLLERPVLLTLLQHLDQALLANQAVEHQHAADEQDQILDDTASAASERLTVRRRRRRRDLHESSCENSAFLIASTPLSSS
jgi:hypothetical protein